MQKYDIYRDIAERCDGDIYIGVVGPVRTGKIHPDLQADGAVGPALHGRKPQEDPHGG